MASEPRQGWKISGLVSTVLVLWGGKEDSKNMILDETLYSLTDADIKQVPAQAGVCMLWTGPTLIEVSMENDLRIALMGAAEKFPNATHFSINTQYQDYASMKQVADQKAKEWNLSKQPIGFAR